MVPKSTNTTNGINTTMLRLIDRRINSELIPLYKSPDNRSVFGKLVGNIRSKTNDVYKVIYLKFQI